MVLIACASDANAQADRAVSDDTSEYLEELVEEGLPVEPSAARREWLADVSLTGLYSTNAGQSAANALSSLYAIPAASVAVERETRSGWRLTAEFDIDGDYFSRDPDDLNETRVTGTVRAVRQTRIGRITLGVRSRSVFGRSLDDYLYTRAGPIIGWRPTRTGSVRLRLDAEYRLSDLAGQRRVVLRGSGAVPVVRTARLGEVLFTQELRLSTFRSGPNNGRRDLRSATSLSLIPALRPGGGFDLRLDATMFHNFSNRPNRRFTDFEIGPTLAFSF